MLLLSFGPFGKREMLDALKERLDSLLYSYDYDRMGPSTHVLQALPKRAGLNLTSMAVLGTRGGLLVMGPCFGIVSVTSYSANEAERPLLKEISSLLSTGAGTIPLPLWQGTYLWNRIDRSLRGKEVSFIHIHREGMEVLTPLPED
ncbi:hypothetical protein AMTRI_Chr10g228540 [Amborella trichopoda]